MAEAADPVLQAVLDGLNSTGFAAEIWDGDWRMYGVTEDYKVMISAGRDE